MFASGEMIHPVLQTGRKNLAATSSQNRLFVKVANVRPSALDSDPLNVVYYPKSRQFLVASLLLFL